MTHPQLTKFIGELSLKIGILKVLNGLDQIPVKLGSSSYF